MRLERNIYDFSVQKLGLLMKIVLNRLIINLFQMKLKSNPEKADEHC